MSNQASWTPVTKGSTNWAPLTRLSTGWTGITVKSTNWGQGLPFTDSELLLQIDDNLLLQNSSNVDLNA